MARGRSRPELRYPPDRKGLTQALLVVERRARKASRAEALRNNHRWDGLHNQDYGVYGWRKGNPWKMSRRQWIERYVHIEDKNGQVVPLILNFAQRRLEAECLRMERAGVPVRILILKARQLGASTYIQAFAYWLLMTHPHYKALLIAHRDVVSTAILEKAHLMSQRMARPLKGEDWANATRHWDFKLKSKAQKRLEFDEPLRCSIKVDSAEAKEPGHGFTCQLLHKSETSRWPGAAKKLKGVNALVAKLPGTYAFNESTADGDVGPFRNDFYRGWEERHLPVLERNADTSLFFPWYCDQQYRYTAMTGRSEFSDKKRQAIQGSLTDEEAWLLQQKYYVRFRGWCRVDFDQLAWRRWMWENECNSDWNDFNEQYPGRPDDAFVSSGRPVFDQTRIKSMLLQTDEPTWRGDIISPTIKGMDRMSASEYRLMSIGARLTKDSGARIPIEQPEAYDE